MDASSCVVITVAYSINKYLSVCLVLLLIFVSLLKQQSCRIAFGRQERAEQLEKEFEHSAEVEKQLGVLYNSHDALKADSVNSWDQMASASNVWTVVL